MKVPDPRDVHVTRGVCPAASYLLVPTLWFGAMSMVSVAESWRTARPKSAMQQVPFFFTRMFFDFRSLCAIAGLPGEKQIYSTEAHQIAVFT